MNRFMVFRWQAAITLFFTASSITCHHLAVAGSPDDIRVTVSTPTMNQTAASPLRTGSASVPPSEIQWHDDLNEGWKAARASKRPMLIFITSDRCRYCDSMKQITWRNTGVLRRLHKGFVAIRLSPDRNAETLSRVHISGYPTTLVGHPDGKILDHKVGYQAPEEINQLLNTAEPHLH